MVTGVAVATLDVWIVKVALVAPAATETAPGTVAQGLLDAKLTDSPAGPAGPLSVTVPADETPAETVDGANVSPARPAGVIVSVAD